MTTPLDLCLHFHGLQTMLRAPSSQCSVAVLTHCSEWVAHEQHTSINQTDIEQNKMEQNGANLVIPTVHIYAYFSTNC